ncbi:T-cell receptor alpha chain V region CTL-F3 [Microtus ochrogaster]|nr:T-cell receptor alpha chain V region CTL-F3 [Microtus ochrogaster]
MKRLLCSLLGLLCTQVCWMKGQQVKQSPVSLVLQEGESTELHCNFSTSTNQVQWFYQSPGGHLITLFYNPSGTKKSGRLKSKTVIQERHSSLSISSSQSTDSGTYFCVVDPQCSTHTCSHHTNLHLGLSQGEQVEQHPSTLRVQEGASAVINCTYVDRTSYNFLWYKQGPREHPKLIVDIHSNMERKQDERLIVFLDKKAKHFSLHITDAQPEDSAMYFWSSNGDSVSQTEGLVTVTEGSPLTLNCTYQTTYSSSFPLWYVQYPNKALQRLLSSATDNKKTENQGFHATLHKSNSSFHLQKPSVQLWDSALYYCAVSDTVRETAGEAAHKPRVQEG